MKNIIATIALMFVSLGVNAQTIFTVTADTFFNFKFCRGMTVSDAFNNYDYITLMGSVGKAVITVNEPARTITMEIEPDTFVLDIIGHPKGNKYAYIYEYYEGERLVRGQMYIAIGDNGGRFMIMECQDETDPNYQKATLTQIR